ncbi:hypothetical protein EV652_101569 [Kribbella steppae]|uniref:ATP/GTP-binding protein n=1 Tax=Kribbella steppae TaxID=2512223 RepID=A0A4R2HW38_9ACTN|nr:hypothetical protein [Kribbella steppae]TCO35684.1 hypothetical protein EV652_101569 [Kribbella steppae]
MLTATLRPLAIALALLASTLVQGGSATANNTLPPKPAGDYVPVCYSNHKCYWILRSVAESGPPTKTTPGKKPAKTVKPVCHYGGALQACTSALGNWSNSHQCYLQRLSPQPPYSDPRWQGHTDGSIWACVRELGYDEGEHLTTRWVWLPGEPDTVVIDPVTLAYRAVAMMELAPPLVKTAPGVGQVGLVNMPVWLWVEKTENTWGPITRSASVPGLSVTATARVTAVNWAMGDGSTVRCEGGGTEYDKSMGIKDSPDCGHRYKKTSRELPKCNYPVAATAQWDITWQSTLGDTGQISMTQEAGTQLRIGEAVPVLVDPNDDSQPAAPAKSTC